MNIEEYWALLELKKIPDLDYVMQCYNDYHTCCGKRLWATSYVKRNVKKEATRWNQFVSKMLCKKLLTENMWNLTALTGARSKKEKWKIKAINSKQELQAMSFEKSSRGEGSSPALPTGDHSIKPVWRCLDIQRELRWNPGGPRGEELRESVVMHNVEKQL